MTLYLKYRPTNLDELDLIDVGSNLKKLLSNDKIPHAFLFAGPKGTGKTSAARILAKIINCDGKNPPCDKCEQCLSITKGTNMDVIEMDAASHRGIDDVRTLRDAVNLAPVSAKKKIYIIDEAHMLTTEASNALLKTLEEPPAHVIFVLATTNPEKLIDTIKSRVTVVSFRKANSTEILRSLKRVVTGEKIKIEEAALEVIASASDGAFRDAIKILEQVVGEGLDLTKEALEEYLFSKKAFDIESFIELLIKKDAKELILEIAKFNEKGVSVQNFLSALLGYLRSSLLSKIGVGEQQTISLEKNDLIDLIELLISASNDISTSPIEELPLELAIIKWCEVTGGGEEKKEIKKEPEYDIKIDDTSTPTIQNSTIGELLEKPAKIVEITDSYVKVPDSIEGVNEEAWKMILTGVKPINASIEALLRAARPVSYEKGILTLGVYYKFHKERLEATNHRKILEDVVTQVLKSPTRIDCRLVEPPPKEIIEVVVKKETVLTEGADRDIIKVAEELFSN